MLLYKNGREKRKNNLNSVVRVILQLQIDMFASLFTLLLKFSNDEVLFAKA